VDFLLCSRIGTDDATFVNGGFNNEVQRQLRWQVDGMDADVLEWLKSQGKGYQSRINAILRREMLTAIRAASK
jgi:hypothetical protein